MMDKIVLLIFLIPLFLVLIAIVGWKLFERRKQQKSIVLLSKMDNKAIINYQKIRKKDTTQLNSKLIQSGITYKEYTEARLVFTIIGLILIFTLPFFFSIIVGAISITIGILSIIFGGDIYLAISKSERVEKINRDLGVFLDLVNVILEAGGSLKNAFFEVSKRGVGIIDQELLKEISILEYEMTNYSTKIAYENFKNRIDSREVDKIVDFLILSEETGIGVKNIFTMQSDEMRKESFYKIKGKVNTLNMYLMLIIFLFVLPAFGAFIIFPMMAGKISMGLN